MSVLDAARRELAARSCATGEAGDWAEQSVLAPLADVADHVCRIGDHDESAHYRADKAGSLLAAAVRVQCETLLGYAGWPEGSPEERAIVDAFDQLEEVRQAIGIVTWTAARHARDDTSVLYSSDAQRLFDAAHQFGRWVDEVATTAQPDRRDED
jgi:hypothetical protein